MLFCWVAVKAPVACMFSRNEVLDFRYSARSSSFCSNSDGMMWSSLEESIVFDLVVFRRTLAGPTRTNLS